MEFKNFAIELRKHIDLLFKDQTHVFTVGLDKDQLWEKYLSSFPEGTNPIYKTRREFDCSECRMFVKRLGNVVVIDENNQIKTIWGFKTENPVMQVVVNELDKFVKTMAVSDVFLSPESNIGVESNHQEVDGNILTWHHMSYKLKSFVFRSHRSSETIDGEIAKYRDIRNVLKRSVEELSPNSVETVLELIAQDSLYKGNEWVSILKEFATLQRDAKKIKPDVLENFYWKKATQVGPVVGKIRNHSMGVLLQDISAEMGLDEAVKRYENIVAGPNYKRSKAVPPSKAAVEQAKKTIKELGFEDSLERRFAVADDITVQNVLFANKDVVKKMKKGSVLDDLAEETPVNPKSFAKLEEVHIEKFIKDVLPTTTSIELFVEHKNVSELMSLTAPKIAGSKSMFKWVNGIGWAYKDNMTDSVMKQNVKNKGGNVNGCLRFSIQWNEHNDNPDDLDAHCFEPMGRGIIGNHIYYGNKGPSGLRGSLDVDIRYPEGVAVENIVFDDISKLVSGKYRFEVHNYASRGAKTGFTAEIEFNGQIFHFERKLPLKQDEIVKVANVEFDAKTQTFKMEECMEGNARSKTVWGIQTNQFVPVSMMMYSPNFWDGQSGIGHKHFFFILKNCKNDTSPNGFFNEFLVEDLMKHRKLLEVLALKMRVEHSDEQLSGLGFSSSKRNSVVCKVTGKTTRMLKINF